MAKKKYSQKEIQYKLSKLSERLQNADSNNTFEIIEKSAQEMSNNIRKEAVVSSEVMKEKFYFRCLTT